MRVTTPLLILLASLFMAAPATANDAKQLWLKAESSANPVEAAAQWKAVLGALPEGQTAGEGLTRDAANTQLFHALLDAAAQTKKKAYLKEAQTVSSRFDIHKKVFADTLLAKTAIKLDKKMALKSLKLARANAMKLKDRREQSESLHAITLALLTQKDDGKLLFGWDGPEIAEDILPHISRSEQRSKLMQMLAQYQQEPNSEWQKKLFKLVKINDKKEAKNRNKKLLSLHKEALEANQFMVALEALTAITDRQKQQTAFYKWFKKTFSAKDYSRAATIADRLDDGKYGAESWGKLAAHYAKVGEKLRTNDAVERSYMSALATQRDDRRIEALVNTAEYAGTAGNAVIAEKALKQAGILGKDIKDRGTLKAEKALGAYIKALAESNKLEEATSYLNSTGFTDVEVYTIAVTATAKSLAENGDPQQAFKLLNSKPLKAGVRHDKAYYATSKSFTKQRKYDQAKQAASKIDDKSLRLKAEAYIDSFRQRSGANENQKLALEAPFFSNLDKKIRALPTTQQERTRLDLTEMFTDEPNLPILAWEKVLTSADAKDEMLVLRSYHLAKAGKTEEAARLMKKVDDPFRRTFGYRKLTKEIALHTDIFGFIGDKVDPVLAETKQQIYSAQDSTQVKTSQLEKKFKEIALGKEKGVELAAPESSDLGLVLPEMDYPERLEFDYEYVKSKLPSITPFAADLTYYENTFFINTKFKTAIAYSDNNLRNGTVTPHLIYLYNGTTTLPLLYDALKAQGLDGYLTREGKEYHLNSGLLVGPDAKLIIDGDEVSKLFQSKQDSAILVNAGELYVTGTKIIAWNKDTQKPAYATFEDRYDFRPFLASWSRSHTYLAGNEFVAQGYSNHKSYGISLSAGPEKLELNTVGEPQRPDGIIVDNSFDNVYYGFYSYEADHVALIGNEYKDNNIYGIDPHDRSRWLTIAYNTAYNSKKKHGIIISREVNDSSYIGNLSFDNKGSGFMIDRLSNGTFVYGNTAFGNKQDGLTLFESSCNFIASNNFSNNKSMGIRVRNSQNNGIFFNHLANNKQGGVTGYISELLDDPAHGRRNFALDPYADVAAMTLVGNLIEDNGTGVIGDNLSAVFLRANRFIDQSPKTFGGKFFTENRYFTSQYDIKTKGVVMAEKCPSGKWIPHHCRFRKDGLYRGDGQHFLEHRVVNSSCQTPSKQDSHDHGAATHG